MIANECKLFWTYVNDCVWMQMIFNVCKLLWMNVYDGEWM